MIAKFAKKINEILIQKEIVQKEDAELYQYGIRINVVRVILCFYTLFVKFFEKISSFLFPMYIYCIKSYIFFCKKQNCPTLIV